MIVATVTPHLSIAGLLGFQRMPAHFYLILGLIILGYILAAEIAKLILEKGASAAGEKSVAAPWPNDRRIARRCRSLARGSLHLEPGAISKRAACRHHQLERANIGRAVLAIDGSKRPLGSHVFTMLDGESGKPSAFVRGRPAHRWMAVKTEGNATLPDLAKRARVSQEFAGKVYEILKPGTTIVVTDDPALPAAAATRAVPLMGGEQK